MRTEIVRTEAEVETMKETMGTGEMTEETMMAVTVRNGAVKETMKVEVDVMVEITT